MVRFLFPVCLLVLVGSAAAEVLWSQPQQDSFGGLSSQDARNPNGLGWFSEVADNFDGQAGWSVNRVEFYGGYATPLGEEGNTEGFTIRFYTDNGGHPGTRIFEQDVFDFTEDHYYTWPVPDFMFAGYHYGLALDPPFDVENAGVYWVSVVAILARGGGADEPQWGWIASTTVTSPFAHQWFFSPGNFTEQSNDVAYSLLSEDVQPPCPGDVNGDNVVDLTDLATLLANFGISGGATREQGDLNADGNVDLADLATLLANFGATC